MTDTKPQGNPQQAAGDPGRTNGTAVYIIGCKLPNGLVCELGKFGDPDYKAIRLNGANSRRIVAPGSDYGITEVPKDFWDKWVKRHARLDFVQKQMVFAVNDEASARDMAKDGAKVRTGLEPLDPMKALPGTTDLSGKPLVEVDMDHFHRGRAEIQRQYGSTGR